MSELNAPAPLPESALATEPQYIVVSESNHIVRDIVVICSFVVLMLVPINTGEPLRSAVVFRYMRHVLLFALELVSIHIVMVRLSPEDAVPDGMCTVPTTVSAVVLPTAVLIYCRSSR